MSEMVLSPSGPDLHEAVYGILDEPFPRRGAVDVLRDRVVSFLERHQPAPGSRFLTDEDLANRSGLSRSTIRRALEPLQREGWLSREVGRGTYVGARLASSPADQESAEYRRTLVRLGVLLFDIGGLSGDWITPSVLAGIDREANPAGLNVEMLGFREIDADSITRRLERSRPEVLASLASQPKDAMMLREAVRLGIKTLVVGTAHQFLGLPTVAEDNRQGMNLALDALRRAGHERIGLIVNRWPGAWVFERQQAFEERLEREGLDPHAVGTCWIGSSDHPALETRQRERGMARAPGGVGDSAPGRHAIDRVAAWLERARPTAVVAGSYLGMQHLGLAAQRLGSRVPDDLSVVGLDQHPDTATWLDVEPTLALLPLEAMGRQVARTARALADGATIDEVVRVPFDFREGGSVA
jgi:DNA-binding LacI/PurR family transcriptional regulator